MKMHVQTLDIIVFYSSDGFEGDLLLWVKMLLPGVNKRVYNLQSKQLIKLFSQVQIKQRCACKSIVKKSTWLKISDFEYTSEWFGCKSLAFRMQNILLLFIVVLISNFLKQVQ